MKKRNETEISRSLAFYRNNKISRSVVHKCPVPGCSYSTTNSKGALRVHIYAHMPETERPFKCEHKGCGRGFAQERILNAHVKKHLLGGTLRTIRRSGVHVSPRLQGGEGGKFIAALEDDKRVSGHRGVSQVKATGKWKATIRVNGVQYSLRCNWESEEVAAKIRDCVAEHLRASRKQ